MIVGIDGSLSHTDWKHHLKMTLADSGGTVLSRVEADETPRTNNAQTDFWLKDPVKLQEGNVYTVTVVNLSIEVVGMYASDSTKADYPGGGFLVDPHDGENAHRMPGWVMSGCIHTPASP
ncbi:hypothetical protein [Streptomyces canus]|uniref:hypothetical protein n=1 Tax=Streptomyces canus TaxID=58343 RepID=UPI00343E926E